MRKAEQTELPIALGIRDLGKRAGHRLLAFIREVVRESGKQESAAAELGISPELLSQALRSQRTFNVEWLPALLGSGEANTGWVGCEGWRPWWGSHSAPARPLAW